MKDVRVKVEYEGTPPSARQLWQTLIDLLADQYGCVIEAEIVDVPLEELENKTA